MHSLQVSSIVAEPRVAKLAMDCAAVTFASEFVVGSGFVTFKEGDTSRRRGKHRRPNDAYWPRCKAYDAYCPNGEYLYTFGDGEVVGPILDLQPCGVFLACCVRHNGRDVMVNLRKGRTPFAKPYLGVATFGLPLCHCMCGCRRQPVRRFNCGSCWRTVGTDCCCRLTNSCHMCIIEGRANGSELPGAKHVSRHEMLSRPVQLEASSTTLPQGASSQQVLGETHEETVGDSDHHITLAVTASLLSGATYTAKMKRHWTHSKVLAALGAQGMPSLIHSEEHLFVGSIKFEIDMRLSDLPVDDGKLHLTIVSQSTNNGGSDGNLSTETNDTTTEEREPLHRQRLRRRAVNVECPLPA